MRARVLHPIADPNAVFFLLFVKVSREPMHDSPERLQVTPLGTVLPPHRECHASYRSASVDEAEDWDALESKLAGDGWAYRTPNRGHFGLR